MLGVMGLSVLRRALAAVAALIFLNACSPAPPPDAVFVHLPPPPAPTPAPASVLNMAEMDADRRAWIAGLFRWDGSEYVWVPGHWERPPQPRAVWVNGVWKHDRRGWYWVPGYWRFDASPEFSPPRPEDHKT